MTVHFIADTHFGHKNILKHCPDRPWQDLEEMHEGMIAQWNDAVKPNDDVYHLGDVSFFGRVQTKENVERLNGVRRLVPGNHDSENSYHGMWDEICPPIHEIKVQIGPLPERGKPNYQKFVLCHYPMMTWNGASRGVIHLHGHSHGNIEQSSTRFDVGVDGTPTWHLGWPHGRPVSAELIVDTVQSEGIEYDAIDHHREADNA